MSSTVDHPPHYGGKDNPYEAIKVIEAWSLGFCLGNCVKYISRAGKKIIYNNDAMEQKKAVLIEDLKKAAWYLQREIERLETLAADPASSASRLPSRSGENGGELDSKP